MGRKALVEEELKEEIKTLKMDHLDCDPSGRKENVLRCVNDGQRLHAAAAGFRTQLKGEFQGTRNISWEVLVGMDEQTISSTRREFIIHHVFLSRTVEVN